MSEPARLQRLLEQLSQALGPDKIRTHPAVLESYAWDNTGVRVLPDGVVLPEETEQVAATLRLCYAAGVPVTPRGAGTGNVGGALAMKGGIVLSLQRMKRIIRVVPADRLAVVQPGVIHAELQTTVAQHGLFWPPDPSSGKVCSIGGNLAMCAAGANAVRFGVTRDWVLGLQAVTADGRIFRTGTATTKGVVGYDLTRLLIGSEGTLAVITEATLKLSPQPSARRLLAAIFASVHQAADAVSDLMSYGEPPSALEFLDRATLQLLRNSGGLSYLPEQAGAMLLLEVCGSSSVVDLLAEEMVQRLRRHHPLEVARAQDAAESDKIWAARFALSPMLKKLAPKRVNEDVVVPVSRLHQLVEGLELLAQESGIAIISFGHAGNGNLHVNLLVDPADQTQISRVIPLLDRLFAMVLSLGGTLSGEHGVGVQKKDYVAQELDVTSLALQQSIKQLFDPKGLLNPDKIL